MAAPPAVAHRLRRHRLRRLQRRSRKERGAGQVADQVVVTGSLIARPGLDRERTRRKRAARADARSCAQAAPDWVLKDRLLRGVPDRPAGGRPGERPGRSDQVRGFPAAGEFERPQPVLSRRRSRSARDYDRIFTPQVTRGHPRSAVRSPVRPRSGPDDRRWASLVRPRARTRCSRRDRCGSRRSIPRSAPSPACWCGPARRRSHGRGP